MPKVFSHDMQQVEALAFAFSMSEEGGEKYTDDPADAGGPTKWGIALNYNRQAIPDKDGNGVIDARDVMLLTEADALKIYRQDYWQKHGCDKYPPALAFVMADMCLNPGPGAAPRLLQQALNGLGAGLAEDGQVGPATMTAIGRVDMEALLSELAARRQIYYATRSKYSRYGLGWTRRSTRCLYWALRVHWGLA